MVSTFDQHSFNKSWTNVERSVQTAAIPFSNFKNKGHVVWMLNENLN